MTIAQIQDNHVYMYLGDEQFLAHSVVGYNL